MNKLAPLLCAAALLGAAPAFAADVRVSAIIDGVTVGYTDYDYRPYRVYETRPAHRVYRRHNHHHWREPAVVYYEPAAYYDSYPRYTHRHHGHWCDD